jgi:large subunit ribosomal protein L25
MIETIEVKKREAVGTSRVNKMRAEGLVPAVLYGHGEANVNLAIRKEVVGNVVRHGTKMVNLTGDIQDTALLREVQWDAFGVNILHVDLARVSQEEAVEVTLVVHLHGEAPGVAQGGQLNFNTHELTIRCPAGAIPEHLTVPVSGLNLGQSIHANEVQLPAGASMVTPASVVVVSVVEPSGDADEATGGPVEPELIRREKAAAEDDKK